MLRLLLTRNASFFSGTTSTTVDVVGQNSRLRRLKWGVRVPWRSGPRGRIQRHCGLHCGIRRKSDINAQTFEAGALISTCACNSGAGIGPPGYAIFPRNLFGVEIAFEAGLCAARATAGGRQLPHEDAG